MTSSDFPFTLDLLPVNLIGVSDDQAASPDEHPTGNRWTIGPTWYANHADDECFDEHNLPYFDTVIIGADDQETAFAAMHTWAESAIAETTDYRVTGWNGYVPNLVLEHHRLEVRTSDGTAGVYAIEGWEEKWITSRLVDPNDVLMFRNASSGDRRLVTHIPVRAITFVRHTVFQEPVDNA
jgi:hypothetical protein